MASRRERKFHLWAQMLAPVFSTKHAEARIRLLAEDASKIKQSPLFHGRLVEANRADMGLARGWLAECEEHHYCHKAVHKGQLDVVNDRRLVVVDVEQQCLCEVPQTCRYLTLSYIWPRFKVTQLERGNRESLF